LPEKLVQHINDQGGGSLALRVRGGDAKALVEALAVVGDKNATAELRRDLIEVYAEIELGEADREKAIETLSAVARSSEDVGLRCAALAALQSFKTSGIGAAALDIFADGKTPDDVRETALALLVSRPAWAAQLLRAVDEERIAAKSIATPALRRILLHNDESNAELVKKHWGEISGATTEAMRAQVTKLASLVRNGSGDPYAGKKTYLQSCAKCHQLFEEGADIGPNLTSYQRDNVEAMLLNVVNPSAEIREGFETFNVYTDDGRVLSGFLADQDDHIVVLRTGDGQRHSLRRDLIEEMQPAPRSIMPENLLDALNEQQVRDLFAYLRSRQPLND
jgi:putative heme-binding domain-containing protein